MPLSSKKVIENINSFNDEQFTAEDIVRILASGRDRRFKGKKKTAPKKDAKDINVIHVTLADLQHEGYLNRGKKGYLRNGAFVLSGKLTVSRSIALVDNGSLQIIVKKEDLGSAQDKDSASRSPCTRRR